MPKPEPTRPRVCDYEGSNYRTEFWENKGRDYEDRVERVALRKLLPANGKRLLEVGAGFGRLTDEYKGYAQVVVLDYSLSQLQHAQSHLGRGGRYIYVAADAYHLPFKAGVFDGVTMVRVIHHMADVPKVLREVRRVMVSNGTFILEHANKRNLKAMLRHALKKQTWNPYDHAPVEFVELNFDFHPEYIREAARKAGFKDKQRIPVSMFRIDALKSHIPTSLLVSADSLMQSTGLLLAPSIFARYQAIGASLDQLNLEGERLFLCPECNGELTRRGDLLVCQRDGLRYAVRDGIYDFKAPLDPEE